jgi:protein-tyrosine kinase
MSRVSDAFRRAAEDRTQGIVEPTKRLVTPVAENRTVDRAIDGRLGQVTITPKIIEQPQNVQPRIKHNSANHSDKVKVFLSTDFREPKSLETGSTLRAWLQQVFFGRDLGRIDSYPLMALEKNSTAGEQYKILREQLNKTVGEHGRRLLAITSPIKGDGKTTVATNLAAAMALNKDRKVLLIDADLRSPSIHRCFGVGSSPGLADYLSSEEEIELLDYIQETSISGLRILPAGKATNHSAELLGSERMKALLQEIAETFPNDQIIIDTSPVLSTSDPLVLCRQLDGLLMVVRAGKTPRECLSEALKLVGTDKIVGSVLNGAELGRAARYYYYYGQQS